jgi:hypothetical protein
MAIKAYGPRRPVPSLSTTQAEQFCFALRCAFLWHSRLGVKVDRHSAVGMPQQLLHVLVVLSQQSSVRMRRSSATCLDMPMVLPNDVLLQVSLVPTSLLDGVERDPFDSQG